MMFYLNQIRAFVFYVVHLYFMCIQIDMQIWLYLRCKMYRFVTNCLMFN